MDVCFRNLSQTPPALSCRNGVTVDAQHRLSPAHPLSFLDHHHRYLSPLGIRFLQTHSLSLLFLLAPLSFWFLWAARRAAFYPQSTLPTLSQTSPTPLLSPDILLRPTSLDPHHTSAITTNFEIRHYRVAGPITSSSFRRRKTKRGTKYLHLLIALISNVLRALHRNRPTINTNHGSRDAG